MNTALQQLVLSTKDQFNAVLSDKSINFDAEAGFAIQALSTDYAMSVAMKNKQSVIDAVTNVSAIGISLNPAKKQAYLVPRDGKICLDISYMGLIDLAVMTGSIKWAQAAVVYTNDYFELRGFDEAPIHRYEPFGNRGEISGVYCVVKTGEGDYLTHSMPISAVYDIRNRSSQSHKSGKSSPWKSDEGEMIKKTCIKQACKYWKSAPRLQEAIHYLNTDGNEGLNAINQAPTRKPVGAVQNAVTDYERVESLTKQLEASALGGMETFKTAWESLSKEDRNAVGIVERDRIKVLAADSKPIIEGEAS